MLAVGLIGFGTAGRVFHAPVIRGTPGLQLHTIVQRSGDSAQAAYPDVRVERDVAALLANKAIQMVVIATPNPTHFELARQCLLAGRHVVVDKPFTVTSVEAAELSKIAKAGQRMLSVYQNRRWDGDFLTVRRLVESGELGGLVLFESHYDRYRPGPRAGAWREQPQPGSGILFDLGSHLIDQALVLFGLPEAVTADVRLEREESQVDDAFDVLLHYPRRLRVVLRATMLACTPGPRFVLHGTRGSFTKFGMDPQEDVLKTGVVPASGDWRQEPPEQWGTLQLCGEGSTTGRKLRTEPGDYRRFYENVRDAILGKAPLAVTAAQGWSVIRLIELARESSRARAAIEVPGNSI